MDIIATSEILTHTIFENSVTRIEGIVTELIYKMLYKIHDIKAELVLTSTLCSLKREKNDEPKDLVNQQQKQYARTATMDINKGDYKTKANQLVA